MSFSGEMELGAAASGGFLSMSGLRAEQGSARRSLRALNQISPANLHTEHEDAVYQQPTRRSQMQKVIYLTLAVLAIFSIASAARRNFAPTRTQSRVHARNRPIEHFISDLNDEPFMLVAETNAPEVIGLGATREPDTNALVNPPLENEDGMTNTNALLPIVNTASYSWIQIPGGSNAGSSGSNGATGSRNSGKIDLPLQPGLNTVTLAPCPLGVSGSDLFHYLYISGTGAPEAVLIAGGTCQSGADTGTIAFQARYSHPVGYSIGSASDGVQEAIIDAVSGAQQPGQKSRNVMISPGTHVFYAKVSVRGSGISIEASGASITCNVSDTCLMLGDASNANAFNKVNVSGLRLRPGVAAGTFPAIEDNAQSSTLTDIAPASGAVHGASFGSLIQVDNDQAATIANLDTHLAAWSRCDVDFCSTAIVGPGPFSKNAGVIWVKDSNLGLNCAANGIDNQNDNTLHVSDTVIEAYAQFGVRANGIYGNSLAAQMDNVYEEVGSCVNPLGTGEAGLIVEGGYAQVSGMGPAGLFPRYANTGSTQFNYYIVVHSTTDGVSAPYLAGHAMTNRTGQIQVFWNRIGRHGIISYDVLRTVGAGARVPLYGTGDFAVAANLSSANCANAVCSFIDQAASSPASYTVAPTGYAPTLRLWPGAVILTRMGDSPRGDGTRYFADYVVADSIISGDGSAQPTVFAQQCDAGANWSPLWMQCGGGSYGQQAGTIYQLGTEPRLKGRVIFEVPPANRVPNSHAITLSDANPGKTLATPMNRPTSDPDDSYIGFDQQGSVPAAQTQLALGSPVSVSQYVGNPGDGTNWLERLTKSLKTFKVPVVSPAYETSSNCVSLAGSCGSAAAGITAIRVGNSSVTISSSAVTARSEIHVDENTTYGPLLGITCDTSYGRQYRITRQAAGSGFTISTDHPPTANPACISFTITN